MELNETKNHYLHPDFDDIGINSEKKPSPLALLLQTCKNIGSIKGNKESYAFSQTFSPYLTSTKFRKLSKRCRSNSSTNSSMTDRDYLSPTKRPKIDNKIYKRKKSEIIEMKNADTSSETSYHSNSSLINNLLQFVKSSNNTQLTGNDKMELLHFLSGQYNEKEKTTDEFKPNLCQNKANHFNVEKGYHLENLEQSKTICYHNPLGLKETSQYLQDMNNALDNCQETLDLTKPTSAIKYCMYCGKLIPLLPMLLAHIRIEHGNVNFTDPSLPTTTNILPCFNPYVNSNEMNPNQTFSFLTDYLSSSFQGLNNLIC